MTTTLSDLQTQLARQLHDTSNTTWSVAELTDLINQGIDALADFYPKEIVQTVGTVSAGVTSYSASSFENIYRVAIYTSAGSYRYDLPGGLGATDSGWELHNKTFYLPAGWTFNNTDTIQAWGYGRYVQLSASTSTTDLDQAGIFAVMAFARAQALENLVNDRAQFQQWQSNTNGTDVTELAMLQTARAAWATFDRQRQRLKRLRKT